MRVYCNEKFRVLGMEFRAPRPGDAGYDIAALGVYTLAPGQRATVETGLHLEIPPGFVGLLKDRSSMAAAGIHTLAGVIDSAYRGELKVLLVNLGDDTIAIEQGQKIAQLLIVPVYTGALDFVEALAELAESARGAGGFGSTGR